MEVVPIALSDLLDAAGKIIDGAGPRLAAEVEGIRRGFETHAADDASLGKLAALKLALADWVEHNALDAVALQCWSALQDAFGVFPCFVHGLLTDEGVPVTCETDIHGPGLR